MNQTIFRKHVRELADRGKDLDEAREELKSLAKEFKSFVEYNYMVHKYWPRYSTTATVARDMYRSGQAVDKISKELDKPTEEIEIYIASIKNKEASLLHETGLSLTDLIKAIQEGLSVEQIMKKFDISRYNFGLFKKMLPSAHGNKKVLENQEMIELYNQGWTCTDIGKKFDISRQAVHSRIKHLVDHESHIKNKKQILDRDFIDDILKHIENLDAIRQDIKDGMSRNDVLKKHGISLKIWEVLKCKIDRRDYYTRKVSIEEIIRMKNGGLSYREISERLGVSVPLINLRVSEWKNQNKGAPTSRYKKKWSHNKARTHISIDMSIYDHLASLGSDERSQYVNSIIENRLDDVISCLKQVGLAGVERRGRIPIGVDSHLIDKIKDAGISIPIGQVIHACLRINDVHSE